MDYFTATPIVKKIIQAYDFKIFIRVRLKAVYLKNGTWLQPKTIQSLNNQALKKFFKYVKNYVKKNM